MNYIDTLDYLFKVVLANRILLAITMKECLNEFKDIDVSKIYHEYIEAHILTDEQVHEKIIGANTEKNTDGKKTTFDILFFSKLPNSKHKIGIIINAEAQSIHDISYDVLNRAHYYNARNISSQYKTLWSGSNYDELRKVVSIWFILDAPKYKQGSLNRYVMKEEHVIGEVCEKQINIDKNEIIMVYLSQGKADNDFIQIVSDIKNKNVDFEELTNKLAKKYGITLDNQMIVEVDQMCNYGSYVFNEGKQEGIIEGKKEGLLEGRFEAILELIKKKMNKKGLSPIESMIELDIEEKDFDLYLPHLPSGV